MGLIRGFVNRLQNHSLVLILSKYPSAGEWFAGLTKSGRDRGGRYPLALSDYQSWLLMYLKAAMAAVAFWRVLGGN